MARDQNLRRLRRKSSHNTLLSILQGHIVACASLAQVRLPSLLRLILCLYLVLDLGVRLFDIAEPSSKIWERSSLQKGVGHLVASDRDPDVGVSLAERVPIYICSEDQMFVEGSEMGLNGFEIWSSQSCRQLRQICGLHFACFVSNCGVDGGVEYRKCFQAGKQG